MIRALLVAVLAAAALATPAQAAAGDLAGARAATAKFHDGHHPDYGLLTDAAGIACIDNPAGGMGIHYVNGTLVADGAVNATTPELLVYEPLANGRQRLVALEYVVFQADWDPYHAEAPELFGREFELVQAGNRYGLPARAQHPAQARLPLARRGRRPGARPRDRPRGRALSGLGGPGGLGSRPACPLPRAALEASGAG